MQFETTVKRLLEDFNVMRKGSAPPVPGDAGDTRQLGGNGGTGYIGNSLETISIDDRILNRKKREKLRRDKTRKRIR